MLTDLAKPMKICKRFGKRVLAIVQACTDATVIPKPPWRERKEAYLKHLEVSPNEVMLVVAADKLHNLRTLLTDHHTVAEAIWSRFNADRTQTLWFYTEVFKRLNGRSLSIGILYELRLALTRLTAEVASSSGASP